MEIDESSKIIKDFMADLSSEYTSADTPYQLYAALDFLTHEAHMMQIVRSLLNNLPTAIHHDSYGYRVDNRSGPTSYYLTLDEALTKRQEAQK